MVKKFITIFSVMILVFSCMVYAAKVESNVIRYSDMIGDNAVYNDAVNGLSRASVINGFEDGTFRPLEKVTRAQFSKMLVMWLDLKEKATF